MLATFRSRTFSLLSRLLSENVNTRLYKINIFHVVLYGCETWSLTLSEEHTEENVWTEERFLVGCDNVIRC
jgi:hypothetical protein